jgi:aldose 1-epimerase
MKTETRPYGFFKGQPVNEYKISNSKGYSLSVINYGATLTDFIAPDQLGNPVSILIGVEDLGSYIYQSSFFGATVGPYANRIAQARFSLSGKDYLLTSNNGPNNLHSGPGGFNTLYWEGETFQKKGEEGVIFKGNFKDGEDGFPGNRKVSVSYSLNEQNELEIRYRMESDKDTPANFTNHGYWNLNNDLSSIENHLLTLRASHYLPVDDTLIPTGELRPVKDNPMDFTRSKQIGKDQEQVPGGYDHNWCLDGEGFRSIAQVEEPSTGRVMEVFTDMPGVQLYTSRSWVHQPVRGGIARCCGGFCLETQFYPDSLNQSDFPDCILKAGDIFESRTMHRFSLK